jgi:hypothetical protein
MKQKLFLITGLAAVLVIISLVFGGLGYDLATNVKRPKRDRKTTIEIPQPSVAKDKKDANKTNKRSEAAPRIERPTYVEPASTTPAAAPTTTPPTTPPATPPAQPPVSTSTLSVILDPNSPSRRLVNANTTGNVLSKLRLTSSGEAINVTQLGLQLSYIDLNSPLDLTRVTLWADDTGAQVGEVIFTSDYAIVTISGFTVPSNGYRIMTIKGDIAAIGTSQPAQPGHLVAIDYDAAASDSSGNSTRGISASGLPVYAIPTGNANDTRSSGVRIFKSTPTLTRLSVPSLILSNGSNRVLYRFSVAAPSTGNVGLYKFTFGVATAGPSPFLVNDFKVYGYNDSGFSQAAYANSGRLNSAVESYTSAVQDGQDNVVEIYFDPIGQAGTNEAIQVPAGQTRYFELVGTIASTSPTSSILTVDLRGDEIYNVRDIGQTTSTASFFSSIYSIHNDFIWSGNSTTTSSVYHSDWANGANASGLPGTYMAPNTFTP